MPEWVERDFRGYLECAILAPNAPLRPRVVALVASDDDAFARRGYEPPLGETEQALAEIWADVLGVNRVARWDHFFDLGGHSLLAIRFVAHLRQRGLNVEVQALVTSPALAEFARHVGGEVGHDRGTAESDPQRGVRRSPLTCSPSSS